MAMVPTKGNLIIAKNLSLIHIYLFYLEVALDTYWAKVISQYTKKYLSPDEAKISNKTYGTEIDLDNLEMCIRDRFLPEM